MERRFAAVPVALEQRVGTDPPLIVGYAACYYRADDPGTEYVLWDDEYGKCIERILPGAFDAVLKDDPDVCALYNHNPDHLLGRTAAGTLTLSKDAKGLRYSITPPDSPLAQGVIASIQRGDLQGSSFSFLVKGQKFVRQGKLTVREILSFSRLADVGPVTMPAYGSTTTGTRAGGDVEEARAACRRALAGGDALRTELDVLARRAALGL